MKNSKLIDIAEYDKEELYNWIMNDEELYNNAMDGGSIQDIAKYFVCTDAQMHYAIESIEDERPKKINVSQGFCPNCNSPNLKYGCFDFDGGEVVYDITCDECKMEGGEHYRLDFTGFSSANNDEFFEGSQTIEAGVAKREDV